MITVSLLKALLRSPHDKRPLATSLLESTPIVSTLTTAQESKITALRSLTKYPNNGYLPLIWPYIASWRSQLELLTHPDVPFRLLGMVHTRSVIEQLRPIGAGETMTLQCSLQNTASGERRVSYDLITTAYIRSELVWKGNTTIVPPQPGPKGLHIFAPENPLDGIGSQSRLWNISQQTARQYAWVSGDFNPIHLTKIGGRLFGFKGQIIHGMWIIARIAAEHETLLRSQLLNLSVQFKRPIILPSMVIYRFWPTLKGVEFRVICPEHQTAYVTGTISES